MMPGYGAVFEVSAAPGIRMHLHPAKGEKRYIASHILDMIYPEGSPGTIPDSYGNISNLIESIVKLC